MKCLHLNLTARLWFLLVASLLFGGCTTVPVRETTIHESPQGSVYLARVKDSRFQATHPISLDEHLIRRALLGVQVWARRGKPTMLLFGTGFARQAFSEREAEFLAPLIAASLARAMAQQSVGFAVVRHSSSGPLTTAGILHAREHSLYLTLTQYRVMNDTATRNDAPDFTGLSQQEIRFVPESAGHPGGGSPFLSGLGDLTTLIIDYERLAKLPEAQKEPAQPADPRGEGASARLAPAESQAQIEIDRLTRENRVLKRRLAEQEAELHELKRKSE